MVFLLGMTHRSDGTTELEYDVSPVDRVKVLTFTSAAHATLDVPADELIGLSLAEIRPPARTRERGRSHGNGA